MFRHRPQTAASLALLSLVGCLPAGAGSDPKAVAIADQVMAALGGKTAWDETRYLHFGFASRRQHWWDKWEGRYRLQGTNREGQSYLVLMNLNTRAGVAWLAGQPLTGDALAKQLENAYGAWINDTYWLLMPYKLQDPGVNLAYDGEEVVGDGTYDKLLLTFEKVGLTPGDRYWAYINRATHRMDRWAYILQSDPAGQGPTTWLWENWARYGKIWLAADRRQLNSDRTLPMSPIEVPQTLPDTVFTDPRPLE
jgi:hypothetical protein